MEKILQLIKIPLLQGLIQHELQHELHQVHYEGEVLSLSDNWIFMIFSHSSLPIQSWNLFPSYSRVRCKSFHSKAPSKSFKPQRFFLTCCWGSLWFDVCHYKLAELYGQVITTFCVYLFNWLTGMFWKRMWEKTLSYWMTSVKKNSACAA